MMPAHPPPPTNWNLPFQLSAGIQTSILMLESLDGRSSPDARQYAGSISGGAPAPPGPPRPRPRPSPAGAAGGGPPARAGAPGGAPNAGGVKGPAATISAVIVAFGMASAFRLSHCGAPLASVAATSR